MTNLSPFHRYVLVPVATAARRVGLTPRTLRRAIVAGELPAFNVDRRTRVRMHDVVGWIERRRRPVEPIAS